MGWDIIGVSGFADDSNTYNTSSMRGVPSQEKSYGSFLTQLLIQVTASVVADRYSTIKSSTRSSKYCLRFFIRNMGYFC